MKILKRIGKVLLGFLLVLLLLGAAVMAMRTYNTSRYKPTKRGQAGKWSGIVFRSAPSLPV